MPPDQLKKIVKIVERGARPVLMGQQGEQIELPTAFTDLFVAFVEAMKRRESVFLMQENEAFTTQAAANFLGVSRQFLVRLLEQQKIPFHPVGTHRRVYFKDLVRFQEERSQKRREGLDAMTADLVNAGVYDRFVPLDRDDRDP